MVANRKPVIHKTGKEIQKIDKRAYFTKQQIADEMGIKNKKTLDYPFSIFVTEKWIVSRRLEGNKVIFYRIADFDFEFLKNRTRSRKKRRVNIKPKFDLMYQFAFNVKSLEGK